MWWSDERFLAMGDEQRNDTMAHAVLLDVVGVPVANVHSMPSPDQYADVGEAARAYVRELAAFGDPCPAFCISVLGMGEDGHVASLFPEHAGLADERVAFAVTDSPKPPPVRISMSFSTINAAAEVVLIASGAGKADAVGLLINDPGPLAVPAAGVHGKHLTVLEVDEAAAAHLPPGVVSLIAVHAAAEHLRPDPGPAAVGVRYRRWTNAQALEKSGPPTSHGCTDLQRPYPSLTPLGP